MKQLTTLLSLAFQLGASFLALFGIYMLMVLVDGDLDLIRILFQPIVGLVVCGLAILVLLLVGLPVRLVGSLHNWWIKKPFIPVIGTFFSLCFIVVAFLPGVQMPEEVIIDEQVFVRDMPNLYLLIGGWLLTGFFYCTFILKV